MLALVALGEALEARARRATAARAYGSIIDLFPARADLRRFAGERLERLRGRRRARAGDRHLREGRGAAPRSPREPPPARLRAAAQRATTRRPSRRSSRGVDAATTRAGRFPGVDRILREDLGPHRRRVDQAEPARARRDPRARPRRGRDRRGRRRRCASCSTGRPTPTTSTSTSTTPRAATPSTASSSSPSGGELYADVTTGYGPECFTIRGRRASAPEPLHAPGALLLARADGLRHGQARDHRARRQGRPHASTSGPSS